MKQGALIFSALLAMVSISEADPPPFGTVVAQWPLGMSGSYAGSGITWVRDSGKLFLMDQGYAGPCRVWKLDVADPPGTIVQVPWTFANLGLPTTDIPWSLAWDSDSDCFWVSQILDQNVYAGCYLLRHVWNGSAWVWGGAPADSWFVGDGSCGGGLQCLWVAGMERNCLTGVFYFAPVASGPGPLTHIGKFNPYTKTNLGRLPYGDSIAGHGLTLMSWDSAYIFTCGWSLGLVKLDTLGRVVQRADSGTGYGPADLAIEVPRRPQPDSTVWLYCMNSHSSNYLQKISTGMTWRQLPSAFENTVSPRRILTPAGVVDSGETVTPTLTVHNGARVPAEDVKVHFTIDTEADVVIYHDSVSVTLPPRTTDTVEFMPWTATGRDSMGAIAWAHWPGDSMHWDDTTSSRFLVRVRRIAIDPVWPPPYDTVDLGSCLAQARLWNLGNVTLTIPFVVGIGPYWDTTWVVNLLAGGSRLVSSTNPINLTSGFYWCSMWTPWGDTTYWFVVRGGGLEHDVGLSGFEPCTLFTGDTWRAVVTATNHGTGDETFCTHLTLADSSGHAVFRDSVPAMLMAGMSTSLVFRQYVLPSPGLFAARCSAHLATDQNWLNNVCSTHVCVLPYQGFAGGLGESPPAVWVWPTHFRQSVLCGCVLPLSTTVDISVYSAFGRKVRSLLQGLLQSGMHSVAWDGRDDAGRPVARGVYHFRLRAGDEVARRKVVRLE